MVTVLLPFAVPHRSPLFNHGAHLERCQPSGEKRQGGGIGRRFTPRSPCWLAEKRQ